MAENLLKRSYVGGYYSLTLDGTPSGLLQKCEGGWAQAPVVQEKISSDWVIKKHLGGMSFSEFNVQLGLAMAKGVYNWIDDTLKCKLARMNGEIAIADFEKNVRESAYFYDALITEVTFPAADASSKDAAFLSLKFQPERIKRHRSGPKDKLPKEPEDTRQKSLFPAQFRCTIDGVNTAQVSKVDAITLKQIVVDSPVGELRDFEREAGHIEVPNIKVTMADSHAEDMWKWYEDFVIEGHCHEDAEKHGSLEYLDSTRKTGIIELELMHLGIFNATPDSQSLTSRGSIRRVAFDMYCEEIQAKFHLDKAPGGKGGGGGGGGGKGE